MLLRAHPYNLIHSSSCAGGHYSVIPLLDQIIKFQVSKFYYAV